MTSKTDQGVQQGTDRAPIEHDLKVWPAFYDDVESGRKPFEVRRADRDYRVGDTLRLREWHPGKTAYTGRLCRKSVTYRLDGGAWGIEVGTCVMGLRDV